MYEVKNVETFMGTEGYGFNCNLYQDGKKIAEDVDTAIGRMVDEYENSKHLKRLCSTEWLPAFAKLLLEKQ